MYQPRPEMSTMQQAPSLSSGGAHVRALHGGGVRQVSSCGLCCPARVQVVFGCDKEPWAAISAALKKGEAKDGEVTLVLERRRPRPPREVAAQRSIFE
jgi:hypothetical protein